MLFPEKLRIWENSRILGAGNSTGQDPPQLKDLLQDTNIVNNQRAEETKKKRRKGRGVGEYSGLELDLFYSLVKLLFTRLSIEMGRLQNCCSPNLL